MVASGLTFYLGQGSSKDWAIDRTHQPHLGSQNHLPSQYHSPSLQDKKVGTSRELTLLIVEYNPSLIVHDVTSPNEVDGRRNRGCSAPLIEDAEVGRAMVDWGVVLESVVRGIVRGVLHPVSPDSI